MKRSSDFSDCNTRPVINLTLFTIPPGRTERLVASGVQPPSVVCLYGTQQSGDARMKRGGASWEAAFSPVYIIACIVSLYSRSSTMHMEGIRPIAYYPAKSFAFLSTVFQIGLNITFFFSFHSFLEVYTSTGGKKKEKKEMKKKERRKKKLIIK